MERLEGLRLIRGFLEMNPPWVLKGRPADGNRDQQQVPTVMKNAGRSHECQHLPGLASTHSNLYDVIQGGSEITLDFLQPKTFLPPTCLKTAPPVDFLL